MSGTNSLFAPLFRTFFLFMSCKSVQLIWYDNEKERKLAMKTYTLITGASGGIGLAFAKTFAQHGHNVILVARNKDKLKEIQEEIEANNAVETLVYDFDLTSLDNTQQLYDELKASSICVDILVNNAGFGDFGPFLDAEWIRQQNLIELNILALTRLTYLFGADMKKRNTGKIINLSSVAAFSAGPDMSLYYASKSFVLSFSEALSEELKHTGVTVTALCPGPTATGFEQNAGMGKSVMFSLFKPATPESVANAGYHAAMKGTPVKYHGFVTYTFNLLARCLPRNIARKFAAKMDRRKA